MTSRLHAIFIGLLAFLALLLFFFSVMRLLTGSWAAGFSQFSELWYLMLPLSAGFGIQVGLYFFIRNQMKQKLSSKVLSANTTSSTIGMIACCAHHLTDVLPYIGLTAVSTLLVNYQKPILILGILSNVIGIIFILRLRRQIK